MMDWRERHQSQVWLPGTRGGEEAHLRARASMRTSAPTAARVPVPGPISGQQELLGRLRGSEPPVMDQEIRETLDEQLVLVNNSVNKTAGIIMWLLFSR